VAAFDEEHRRLLALANDIQRASLEGREREDIAAMLDRLREETSRHFVREEEWMRSTRYADSEDHRAKHNKLNAEILLFMQQYQAGHIDPARLAGFLIDWILHHILHEDMKYKEALRETGVQ
jgi:hemerythrin-like metal-binding protein